MNGILLWARERFPPINLVVAGFTYFATALCLRKFMGTPSELEFFDIMAWIVLTLHLLILRVIDEHKDFEWDCANHPERILQRGVIDLKTIRRIGFVSMGIVLVFTIARGIQYPIVFLGFALTYLWTFLMAKEFFLGEKLRDYVFLYSFTQHLISPFLIFWSSIWVMGETPSWEFLLPMMGCSLFASLSFEIARKTKGKEEDVPAVPSYSNSYAIEVPVVLMASMAIGMLYSVHRLSLVLRYPKITWIPAVGLAILGMFAFSAMYYVQNQNKKGRIYNEGTLALMSAFVFVSAIVMGW